MLCQPAYGALGQSPHSRQLQVYQSPSNISLCHPQLNASLLEAFGELLQIPGIRVVVAPLEVVHVLVLVVEDLRGWVHGLRVEVAPVGGGFRGW